MSEIRRVFDEFPTPAAQKESLARLRRRERRCLLPPPRLPLPAPQADALARRLDGLPAWGKLRAAGD